MFNSIHTSPSPTTTFSVQQLSKSCPTALSLSLSLSLYFSELLFVIHLHIFALFLPFSCSSWHVFKTQNQILTSYFQKLLILTGNLYSKLSMLNLKKLPGRLKSFKGSTFLVFFVSAKKEDQMKACQFCILNNLKTGQRQTD